MKLSVEQWNKLQQDVKDANAALEDAMALLQRVLEQRRGVIAELIIFNDRTDERTTAVLTSTAVLEWVVGEVDSAAEIATSSASHLAFLTEVDSK
jgi:hypothetical protein